MLLSMILGYISGLYKKNIGVQPSNLRNSQFSLEEAWSGCQEQSRNADVVSFTMKMDDVALHPWL